MTQDEILEMVREAGFEDFDKWAEHYPQETKRWCERMEAFAKLVAKHTLMNIDPSKFMSHHEGIEAGRLAEREACAKLCAEDGVQAMDFTGGTFVGGYFAEKIKARGEQA
jgi:hypothetical protein